MRVSKSKLNLKSKVLIKMRVSKSKLGSSQTLKRRLERRMEYIAKRHCKEVEQLAAELANARNSLREQNFNDLTHKFFSDVTLEGKQPSSSLVALHLAVSAARKENRNKESTCKDRIIWDQRTSVSCKDKIIWDQKAEIKVLSKQVEKLQVKADKWKRKFQGVRS
jgi:hypothetical protein